MRQTQRQKDFEKWEGKLDLFVVIAMVCMVAFAFLVLVTIHLYTSSNTCNGQLTQSTTVAKQNLELYRQCMNNQMPVFTNITATITRCGNDTG